MVYTLLHNAISHPGILLQRGAWMNQRITMKEKQIELFFELDPSSNPIFHDLPMARVAELVKVLSDLLLDAAVGDAEVQGGNNGDA
jgi:hypothetical protein